MPLVLGRFLAVLLSFRRRLRRSVLGVSPKRARKALFSLAPLKYVTV